jgi:hypothetical protein
MNGHVAGPLVRGQKVRVVLLGTVERSHGGWELYCDSVTLPLDSEAIVSIEFIDGESEHSKPKPPSPYCGYQSPSGAYLCELGRGHEGRHSRRNHSPEGKEDW